MSKYNYSQIPPFKRCAIFIVLVATGFSFPALAGRISTIVVTNHQKYTLTLTKRDDYCMKQFTVPTRIKGTDAAGPQGGQASISLTDDASAFGCGWKNSHLYITVKGNGKQSELQYYSGYNETPWVKVLEPNAHNAGVSSDLDNNTYTVTYGGE